MVRTASTMLPLGTQAPKFSLPDTQGHTVTLGDFKDAKALLVVFMCNHCPFVKHVLDGFLAFAGEYGPKGLAIVGISSNDVEAYPEDAPEQMAQLARDRRFPFPYLYDQTQEVAMAHHAACTPDLFLFDVERRLAYRGQFDDSRPGNGIPVTCGDLRAAADAVLAGRRAPTEQKPSMGCNIKWKPSR